MADQSTTNIKEDEGRQLENLKELVIKLYEIDALKFGNFKMKVGINSPVYFDLRVIVSYPEVMESLSMMLYEFAKQDLKCTHVCGVPYTALPLATLISTRSKLPMLLRRKESKDYGTRKMIEGKFIVGDTVVIIEDVVTSGSSIVETVRDLEHEGLKVNLAIVTVDREQGGIINLAEEGIKMKSLLTLSKIMEILCEAGKVEAATVESVRIYIEKSQIRMDGSFINGSQRKVPDRMEMSYKERSEMAVNPVARNLLALMAKKETNLCVAADLTTTEEVLQLARDVGSHICLFKTHVDIIENFSVAFIKELQSIAEEFDFMIMEDRKFSDIGHLVGLQYSSGIHAIANWADIVTVHPVSGDGVVSGLEVAANTAAPGRLRSCFLVAEMSSKGNLNSPHYIAETMNMAANHESFVSGIVCQSERVVKCPGMIQLTPGVRLSPNSSSDNHGQQYNSPKKVIIERGADIAVVGRGITEADNRGKEAMMYRELLWAAYKKRILATF